MSGNNPFDLFNALGGGLGQQLAGMSLGGYGALQGQAIEAFGEEKARRTAEELNEKLKKTPDEDVKIHEDVLSNIPGIVQRRPAKYIFIDDPVDDAPDAWAPKKRRRHARPKRKTTEEK